MLNVTNWTHLDFFFVGRDLYISHIRRSKFSICSHNPTKIGMCEWTLNTNIPTENYMDRCFPVCLELDIDELLKHITDCKRLPGENSVHPLRRHFPVTFYGKLQSSPGNSEVFSFHLARSVLLAIFV